MTAEGDSEPPDRPWHILAAGPAAFYLQLEAPAGEATSRWLADLQQRLHPRPAGVRELIVGYTSLLVEHDPVVSRARVLDWLRPELAASGATAPARRHVLPVRYGDGADREDLVRRLGLEWEEIVRLHQHAHYTVAFIGFTPGFPYLLGLPERLRLPRRDVPRQRVPAGSVALAGAQAGIYPADSPGGWWVLGRTNAQLYRPRAEPPTLLAAGDSLRFSAVSKLPSAEAANENGWAADGPPALRVLRAWPRSASLQAAPRWGLGHYGLAQAGALDPLAFDLACELVGNPKDALALELVAQPLELRCEAALTLAATGGGFRLELNGREAATWRAHALAEGTQVTLKPDARAGGYTSYLAVRGGLAGESYGGSSSTDARGRVGGLGRFLASGDALHAAGLPVGPARSHPASIRYPERILLRLHPGPQYHEPAFELLLGSSFRIALLDRMGARLAGPRVELGRHDILSEGSPWGAVQLPPSGQPIILLADRGRTGGYAKPAVVDSRDLWRLAQARPGSEVWFTAADTLTS